MRIPSVIHSLQNVLYPPTCLCCKGILPQSYTKLCPSCLTELQLLSTFNRCRRCFHPLDEDGHRCHRSSLHSHAFCFEASPLLQALLSLPGTAIAPFIVLQWIALCWPMPDLIIPTPGDWFSHESDRWNTRRELAFAVGTLLDRPVLCCLGLHRHLLPIPYLSLEEQPSEAVSSGVKVHPASAPVNMNVLLIHDTCTTGKALRCSAAALVNHGACSVRGISLVDG